MERARRLFGLLIVLIVAGVVILVVTVRPGLRKDSESVDRSWAPLVQPLDVRFRTLDPVITQLKIDGAGNRTATIGLTRLLERWRVISTGTDTADQVRTANRIEEYAARVSALARTARLSGALPLQDALGAYEKTRAAIGTQLDVYNAKVGAYQHQRDAFWSQIVAKLDGYPMRPTLQLS